MSFSKNTSDQILGTLRNQLGAAEGSLLPPPQKGAFRVPFVTNLQTGQTVSFVGGTQFTLTFNEPTFSNGQIDHYNIFVGGLTSNKLNFNGPNTTLASPAIVRVTTTVAQTVIFKIQTVLSNGLVSDINASPTCTGTTIAATITGGDIPAGSIDISKLANQTAGSLLDFNASGVPSLIVPVAAGEILTSTSVSTPPVYETKTQLKISTTQFDHFADVGNTDTSEDTLYSDTMTAGLLGVNGDQIHAYYGGTIVGDATHTRQIRIYFGGTKIFDTGANVNSTGGAWSFTVRIMRESATVVRASVSGQLTGPVTFSYNQYTRVTGLTLSGTNILLLTGQSTGVANDVVASIGFGEWISAA